jgi:hypothetical protein
MAREARFARGAFIMKLGFSLPFAALIAFSTAAAQNESVPAVYDRDDDAHQFTVFMRESGWCWYQDPRALIADDHLFIGSVKGTGDGPALVGIFDLQARQPVGTAVMHDRFDHDDHNSPVFHRRPDGSVLAVYALHGRDFLHRYRISDPENPLLWSSEQTFHHDYEGAGKITYMNLFELRDEQLLYNFHRGINFNPAFIVSRDQGDTWEDPTHFIASELHGRHRPYARYASNGTDTVHVSFTDGHPRRFGNSIYYTAYRQGQFHRADGTLIKSLAVDGPLRPSEAERVYRGSGSRNEDRYASAAGAAWTSETAVDAAGHPHIAYTLYLANHDNRYRLASWNGEEWIDREVAYAGNCLYDREASYTGLISMDPVDPAVVFISTDVHPSTGEDSGGSHEIYRARIGPTDDISTIVWTAVTGDSPVQNLRPMILRDGDRRVVIWNRGDFRTYLNYQLDAVGLIETVATAD